MSIPEDELIGWCSSCDKLWCQGDFDPNMQDGMSRPNALYAAIL